MTTAVELSRSLMIMYHTDNVAVCLRALNAGDEVRLSDDRTAPAIQVFDAVPLGHKVALSDIPSGQPIIKYGEIIGRATRDILRGQHVHTHNISDH